MPKTKKELSMKEQIIKEITSCNKKIKKLKNNVLECLNENEENILLWENIMDISIEGFDRLINIAENSTYKDDKDEFNE